MCGIAGVLAGHDGEPISLEAVKRMLAMIDHRGPDGFGVYRDDAVALGHARLSIIDLMGGFQPIHNEDKTVWLSFNGEIFNYLELRESLEAAGHKFSTDTDSEVIVHSFEEYGPRAWEMFNGQFAFALWDSRSQELWLVRDRLGILPLYYAQVGKHLLFASEAKSLFASGRLVPRLDPTAIAQTFVRWSVSPPASTFEQVRSLRPGTALRFDRSLRTREEQYWRPCLVGRDDLAGMNDNEAAEALREQLSDAVNLRLRADVPVGAYLSGGLDSSVIGSLIRAADSSPLQTFAVRFEDPGYDETREQRLMASLLGTTHNEIVCGSSDIRETMPDVIWHCETPLLRTAPVPLFMLSRLVRDSGMKVVLTGEGADEILAGYNIFKEDKIRRAWASGSTRRSALLRRLYPYVGNAGSRDNPMWGKFFGRRLEEVDHPFYSHLIRWENSAWTLRFLSPELRDAIDIEALEEQTENEMPPGWREWSPLARAESIEIKTFMSTYLLSCQGDRVAMAHGVEVRYPFLDPNVVEHCFGLPDKFKLRGLRDKRMLRQMASDLLPREIFERPKRPYRAPMTMPFFEGKGYDYVDELLSDSGLGRYGLIAGTPAARLVAKARTRQGRLSSEREEMALVGVLSLQLLAYHYLQDFPQRLKAAGKRAEGLRFQVCEDRTTTMKQ